MLRIGQGQGPARTLFGAKSAGHAFEGYRFIVVVVHEALLTFPHTDQAAHAFIFGDPDHTVTGPVKRNGAAHFHAVAALITNLNPVLVFDLHHPDGALFPVGCFEIGPGTDLFAEPAAGTF